MKEEILKELTLLEQKLNIKILYAVESGSRAWGFESINSDWDVRFIYVHNIDWYLSIEDKKDNYEKILSNDIDLSGWELRKTLQLFRKSNPPLLEWLNSPIVYIEKYNTVKKLKVLSANYFNPKACMYHYLNIAENNYKTYMLVDPVRTKKYFYALRPLLACFWIEKYNTIPPMEFEILLNNRLPEADILKNEILQLLSRKRNGEELASGPRIDLINDFIEKGIACFKRYLNDFDISINSDSSMLDELFRETLLETGSVLE